MDLALMRKRLVISREACGFNRKAFAEALGIPYRTVTNYENGAREAGSAYLVKVAERCHVTTDWLLGLSDDPLSGSQEPALSRYGEALLDTIQRNFQELNEEGQEKLADYSTDLVAGGRYIKNSQSSLGKKA